MKRFALVSALFYASLFDSSAFAADQLWTASDVSGSVTAQAPLGKSHAVARGETFAPATVITTGRDGKLTFSDGKTVITVAANSRLTTPADQSDTMTKFVEDLGSVFFKVEKRPEQHFEVQTPLVAAIVKGTQFTVTATGDDDAVSVVEGLVQVVAAANGASEFVPAGHAARAQRGGGLVHTSSLPTKSEASSKITGVIGATAIDYADVTGGLVQTQAVTPIVTTSTNSEHLNADNGTSAIAAAGDSSGNVGNSGGSNGEGNNGGGNGNSNSGDTGNGNSGGNGNSNSGGNGNSGSNGNSNSGGNGNGNSGNGNSGGNGPGSGGGPGNGNGHGNGNGNGKGGR